MLCFSPAAGGSNPLNIERDRLEQVPLKNILSPEALQEFCFLLPKIELHSHLEGAIFPELAVELAQRFGIDRFPQGDAEAIRSLIQVTPEDRTLLDFIKKFDTLALLFKSPEVISEIAYQVIKDAASRNIVHLELRFSPFYMASAYGLDHRVIIDAVIAGRDRAAEEFGLFAPLILIIERQLDPTDTSWLGMKAARSILRYAWEYREQGVVGIDLANDEYNFPPHRFAGVFRAARRLGMFTTAHAGEAGGPENVRAAVLDLQVHRVGHAIRAALDQQVVELLKLRKILVEMNPTSNRQTGTVDDFEDYPLRSFLKQGLALAIGTDDSGVCGVNLDQEWLGCCTLFDLSFADVRQILSSSVEGTFLPKTQQSKLEELVNRKLEALPLRFIESRVSRPE